MLSFFEEVISVTEYITSEGIAVKCHVCAKRENIKHPKSALFVVSGVKYQESLTTTSKYRSYSKETPPGETNVDKHSSIGDNTGAIPERPHISDQNKLEERKKVNERISEQKDMNYTGSARQLKETETKLKGSETGKSEIEKLSEDTTRKFYDELVESRKNLTTVIGENDKLNTTIKDLENDLQDLKDRNTKLQKEIDKSKEENDNLQKNVGEF